MILIMSTTQNMYNAKILKMKRKYSLRMKKRENAIRYMAGFVVRKVQKLDAKDVEMLIESDKAAITDSSSAE